MEIAASGRKSVIALPQDSPARFLPRDRSCLSFLEVFQSTFYLGLPVVPELFLRFRVEALNKLRRQFCSFLFRELEGFFEESVCLGCHYSVTRICACGYLFRAC